jgi:hypothetical protein
VDRLRLFSVDVGRGGLGPKSLRGNRIYKGHIGPLGDDVDILYDSFMDYFTQVCGGQCSTTVTKRRSKGSSVRNWIDEEIINLTKAKRYWQKKLIDNRDNELIEAEYKLVLNRLTAARRAKKFRFYERKFGDGSEGPKETWKNIELTIHDGV